MVTRINNATARAVLDALNGSIDAGTATTARINFYEGPQPARPENPASGSILLATVPLPNPCFQPAIDASGQIPPFLGAFAEANTIPEADVITSGTAQWFRVFSRDSIGVRDGSVSDLAGNGDCKLEETTLIAGRKVRVISWFTRYPQ